MRKHDISNRYHFWLTSLVCDEYHQRYYQALLETLHEQEFIWLIPNDMNRAADGIDLRGRFAEEHNLNYREISNAIKGNCSVLEMMVGLACRCEDTIMGDEEYGDRTNEWFWNMITSLNLQDMNDEHFNERRVNIIIKTFLYRNYERSGRGGLFSIPGCRKNMRKVEIWYQMNEYLNTIV